MSKNAEYTLVPVGTPAEVAARLMMAPVSRVQWVLRSTLQPNNYNPNSVAPPEMDLLETSILEDGFTQPVVISRHISAEQTRDVIVDGFHRYTVSGRPRIVERYAGHVPIVFMTPRDAAHQMMSTIRHNRARGTHGVLPMAEIIQAMVNVEGYSMKEIMERLGMEKEEVVRLANRAGLTQNDLIKNVEFSRGWTPT